MNKLNKLYETLTNDERIRLYINALARKDDYELDQLEDSCPRKRYVMADYAFTTKKVDALVMTSMQMLDSYRAYTIATTALIALIAVESSEHELDGEIEEIAREAFEISVAKFKAKEHAWQEFCDEAGLDPKQTREAFQIDVPWGEDGISHYVTPLMNEISPDAKDVQLFKGQLHSIWGRSKN